MTSQRKGEQPQSILDLLTRAQVRDLWDWANAQGEGSGVAVDLMRWPGWVAALQARSHS